MPPCKPRCPIVRAQLKQIVTTEAPWIWKEEISSSIGLGRKGRDVAKTIDSSSLSSSIDQELLIERLEVNRDDIAETPLGAPKLSSSSRSDHDLEDDRYPADRQSKNVVAAKEWQDVTDLTTVKVQAIKKEGRKPMSREVASEGPSMSTARIYRTVQEVGTVQTDRAFQDDGTIRDIGSLQTGEIDRVAEIDRDDEIIRDEGSARDVAAVLPGEKRRSQEVSPSTVERGVEPTARVVSTATTTPKTRQPGPTDRADSTELQTTLGRTERDFAKLRDECEPNCPRQISIRNRIHKLEERQNVVDSYLLNKGTGYFDDVCTCSLSCVLHALRADPFVRSILASAALFALGLKLSSEMDAWYLPVRLR